MTVLTPGSSRAAGTPPRVLIVEDERNIRDLVTLHAGLEGWATTAVDDGRVVLRVRDTGPGIPAEHLSHVFDRFYKADASRAETAGSGLGLSIVRAIVERHGGEVTARNAPDGGAVFELRLPPAEPPREIPHG